MFKWETSEEYKYRCKTSEIGLVVGELMNKIFTFKGKDYEKYKIYKDAKITITLQYTKLFELKTPVIFAEIDKYLRESHLYYLKALDILIEVYSDLKNINNEKNISKLHKAGTFIHVGNSFVTIVSCKSFEMFEKQHIRHIKTINDNNNDLNLSQKFIINKGVEH
jgi:hypothetical protein